MTPRGRVHRHILNLALWRKHYFVLRFSPLNLPILFHEVFPGLPGSRNPFTPRSKPLTGLSRQCDPSTQVSAPKLQSPAPRPPAARPLCACALGIEPGALFTPPGTRHPPPAPAGSLHYSPSSGWNEIWALGTYHFYQSLIRHETKGQNEIGLSLAQS